MPEDPANEGMYGAGMMPAAFTAATPLPVLSAEVPEKQEDTHRLRKREEDARARDVPPSSRLQTRPYPQPPFVDRRVEDGHHEQAEQQEVSYWFGLIFPHHLFGIQLAGASG